MVSVPPIIPQSNQRVNKTYVTDKDPHHHHRDDKEKQDDESEKEITDEIEISVNLDKKNPEKPKGNNPLIGHVDIEA